VVEPGERSEPESRPREPRQPDDPGPDLVQRLRAAGCVYAEDEAALLLEHTGSDQSALAELVAAREAGQPLETLLGWVGFDGLRVRVAPGVFVPRQRSVLLVEQAAAVAPPDGVVVDLCCGSGALGAAVAARRPDVQVWAGELDPVAVACARTNLPPERVGEGDLYDALPHALLGRVDVLVVNAPYVPHAEVGRMPREARDHEPRRALDGGGDGLDVHRRVAADAPAWLAPRGVLLIEVAPAQVTAARGLLAAHRLDAEVVTDDERGATVLRARRQR